MTESSSVKARVARRSSRKDELEALIREQERDRSGAHDRGATTIGGGTDLADTNDAFAQADLLPAGVVELDAQHETIGEADPSARQAARNALKAALKSEDRRRALWRPLLDSEGYLLIELPKLEQGRSADTAARVVLGNARNALMSLLEIASPGVAFDVLLGRAKGLLPSDAAVAGEIRRVLSGGRSRGRPKRALIRGELSPGTAARLKYQTLARKIARWPLERANIPSAWLNAIDAEDRQRDSLWIERAARSLAQALDETETDQAKNRNPA